MKKIIQKPKIVFSVVILICAIGLTSAEVYGYGETKCTNNEGSNSGVCFRGPEGSFLCLPHNVFPADCG